jgi:glycosyltransferase involved in cell wall biosynthesis
MRIAVWHDLPSGGGKRALYDHVAELVKRGHEVSSWCTPTADQDFLRLGDLVPERIVPMAGVGSTKLSRDLNRLSKGAVGIRMRLKAMDEHSRLCASDITAFRPAVTLAASSFSVAVSQLGRYLRVPTVLYLGEPSRYVYEALPRPPWPALPPAKSPLAALERLRDATRTRALRIQAREELASVRAYDRVLANSLYSRESMLRAYGLAVRVCYLGVDVERYVDQGLEREDLVAGIGAFAPHKRVEVAIGAVASTPAPRPRLTWIGNAAEGRYLAEMVELARRLGVAFEPLVSIPHERVVDILNRARVMVYAPRLEPFGFAPLEAGACGLPVVAKAEGGVRESVVHEETGLLVAEDEELAPALARLLGEPALARRMGAAARRRVESSWSLGAAADRLESQLLEVAADGS